MKSPEVTDQEEHVETATHPMPIGSLVFFELCKILMRLVHNMLPLERICQTAAKVLIMNGMIHALAINLGKLEGPHCSPEPWNDGKFTG